MIDRIAVLGGSSVYTPEFILAVISRNLCVSEIALVGKAPGRYNLMLGADHRGQRLNTLYRENITEPQILAELEPLFERYAADRQPGEGFGDFLVRTGVVDIPAKDRRAAITIESTLVEEPA